MSEVWIDNVDVADYGFVLGANPAHAASPSFTDPSVALLGSLGAAWAGEATQSSTRKLNVTGNVKAPLGTSASLLSSVDSLKQLAAQGAKRLRFADRPDREYRDARLTDFIAPPRAAILANIACDLSMAFECVDPLMYDVNQQGIALSGRRAALPVGTGPSLPLIILHGGGGTLTNPTLTYRNSAGDIKQVMGFTVSLGANDYLVIDRPHVAITRYTAGTPSDGTTLWTSGLIGGISSDFIVFRAADGYVEVAEYPTLEVTATGGVPAGVAMYARAWI